MITSNNFLLHIGRQAKKDRISYWNDEDVTSIRFSREQGQTRTGLWFRTNGCAYDHQGGCMMCDYSSGPRTTASEMADYVKQGLMKIPEKCHKLLVSPSGSMLDEREVPADALEGILALLASSPHDCFSFETRAETITEETVSL